MRRYTQDAHTVRDSWRRPSETCWLDLEKESNQLSNLEYIQKQSPDIQKRSLILFAKVYAQTC